MVPAIRTQVDEEQDRYSLEAGLNTQVEPDMARQEYKRESDVNYILSRFGVDAIQRSPLASYGEADFDLDLHSGFIAIEAAQLAWRTLPAELRAKYRNEQGMLDAANTGEFTKDLKAHEAAQEAAKAAPPAVTGTET